MTKLTETLTLATVILLSYTPELDAQQLGVGFDSELQFTPEGYANHVNLLSLSAEYTINDHLALSAATISIAKTRDESLLDDLQGFSNLEADRQALALSLLGIGWTPGDRHSLFFGIRTVNEDYFVSPVTSLFFNSSCGIFPTLSYNMDIANYPLASVGLHYSYTAPSFGLQASVYNGQAYDRWAGRDNVWRVTPHSDGLFIITQGDWQLGTGRYYVGGALHTGVEGTASGRSTLWAYTEQAVTDQVSLIADYSHAFGHSSECTDFVGLGGQYAKNRTTIGLFTDYVRFQKDEEWATELTYRRELTPIVSLQASYEFIRHDSWQSAGIIRLSIQL